MRVALWAVVGLQLYVAAALLVIGALRALGDSAALAGPWALAGYSLPGLASLALWGAYALVISGGDQP